MPAHHAAHTRHPAARAGVERDSRGIVDPEAPPQLGRRVHEDVGRAGRLCAVAAPRGAKRARCCHELLDSLPVVHVPNTATAAAETRTAAVHYINPEDDDDAEHPSKKQRRQTDVLPHSSAPAVAKPFAAKKAGPRTSLPTPKTATGRRRRGRRQRGQSYDSAEAEFSSGGPAHPDAVRTR